MNEARVIPVRVAGGAYDVTIEPGLLRRVGSLVERVAADGRALLAVDERIASDHGRLVAESLADAGFETVTVNVRAAESAKTVEAVRTIHEAMLSVRLERGSPVIALGGGIVGDTAGFAAATFLRGVPLIQVPTTLLAMVDASIGGKTGVNFPLPGGGLGKNLIGAFWQPRAVLADPEVLSTLDARDFRCGLAECVKAALIGDASLLDFLIDNAQAIAQLRIDTLVTLIERCCRLKAGIVEADERETGCRVLLNLGHTFAHAIEARPELDVRHGEAVSIGLAAAARCAVRSDRLQPHEEARIIEVLAGLGLPVRLPGPAPIEELMDAMRYDKKTRGGRLRLVLPVGLGNAEITEDLEPDEISAAWKHVGSGT